MFVSLAIVTIFFIVMAFMRYPLQMTWRNILFVSLSSFIVITAFPYINMKFSLNETILFSLLLIGLFSYISTKLDADFGGIKEEVAGAEEGVHSEGMLTQLPEDLIDKPNPAALSEQQGDEGNRSFFYGDEPVENSDSPPDEEEKTVTETGQPAQAIPELPGVDEPVETQEFVTDRKDPEVEEPDRIIELPPVSESPHWLEESVAKPENDTEISPEYEEDSGDRQEPTKQEEPLLLQEPPRSHAEASERDVVKELDHEDRDEPIRETGFDPPDLAETPFPEEETDTFTDFSAESGQGDLTEEQSVSIEQQEDMDRLVTGDETDAEEKEPGIPAEEESTFNHTIPHPDEVSEESEHQAWFELAQDEEETLPELQEQDMTPESGETDFEEEKESEPQSEIMALIEDIEDHHREPVQEVASAIESVEETITEQPPFDEEKFFGLMDRVLASKTSGDPDGAIESLKEMIEMQPPLDRLVMLSMEAYRLYQMKGNYQKARSILELVLYNEENQTLDAHLRQELYNKLKYNQILEEVLYKFNLTGLPIHLVPRYVRKEMDEKYRLWLKEYKDRGV